MTLIITALEYFRNIILLVLAWQTIPGYYNFTAIHYYGEKQHVFRKGVELLQMTRIINYIGARLLYVLLFIGMRCLHERPKSKHQLATRATMPVFHYDIILANPARQPNLLLLGLYVCGGFGNQILWRKNGTQRIYEITFKGGFITESMHMQ